MHVAYQHEMFTQYSRQKINVPVNSSTDFPPDLNVTSTCGPPPDLAISTAFFL